MVNTTVRDAKESAEVEEKDPLLPGEIVLGSLTALDSDGKPLVIYPQSASGAATVAVSTLPITRQHIGRQVALLFADGDHQKPVIMGFIHSPLEALLEQFAHPIASEPGAEDEVVFEPAKPKGTDPVEQENAAQTLQVDGKRVVIEGKEEISLRCGESSITLTKAGKVIIRGKYLVSRSSGVNRILGGSVQVN